MEPFAALLKHLLEKSNLLVGLALTAIVVAVLRFFGQLQSIDAKLIDALYVAGILAGLILVTGAITSGLAKIRSGLSKRRKRSAVKARAIDRFVSIPVPHKRSLLWMFVFDQQQVSVQGGNDMLDALWEAGYLEKDFPDEFHELKTYRMTDEMWMKLQTIPQQQRDEMKMQLREENPPWLESWRI